VVARAAETQLLTPVHQAAEVLVVFCQVLHLSALVIHLL
jgi:hypothetical protein